MICNTSTKLQTDEIIVLTYIFEFFFLTNDNFLRCSILNVKVCIEVVFNICYFLTFLL